MERDPEMVALVEAFTKARAFSTGVYAAMIENILEEIAEGEMLNEMLDISLKVEAAGRKVSDFFRLVIQWTGRDERKPDA